MAGGTKSAAIKQACLHCAVHFVTTVKRAWRTRYCGARCMAEHHQAVKRANLNERRRECVVCGGVFFPRHQQIRNTGGKYCSVACAFSVNVKAIGEKGRAERKRNLEQGLIKLPSGPANKQWRGGLRASLKRNAAKRLAAQRRYRRAKPDKVREFTQSRSRRKLGRLQKGTVSRLFELQRGRCAACREKLSKSFHVDHVVPLALGGEHRRLNIQLLCRSCNVRKSAKDPVRFMQESGYLL